ncbi:uncharacterized protein LOC125178419 [Hyalella azteca]|uniref:Uncharacterized protein LOC125178419 n=1 Tax=Hyalella azteca TaxID=294128 RepID=A0A979FMV8_HYAAZ|nr:uncharacterized protein LOC125178419 [Hyalella azteca]
MLYSSLHQDEGRQPEIMHQIRPIADKDNVTANSVQGLLPFVQPTALIGPESSKDDKQKELLNVIMHQDGQKLNSSQLPSSAQNACGNLKVNSVQEQQILSQNQPTLPEPVLEEQPSKQNGSLHCTKPLPPQQSQEQQVHAMRDRHTQSPKLHHQSIHPMQQQKELQAEQHLQRSLQMQQQSQTKNIQPMQQHNQPQAVQQMQLSLQTQNQSQQQQLLQQHPQYQHQAQILQSSHLLQQDLQQVQIQSHYQAVQSHHQSIESQHQQIQSQHLHIQSQQQQDQVMSQQGIQQTQQMTIYPRTAYSAPPPTAFTPNVYPHAALQGGLIYNPSLMTTPTNNQQAAAAYLSLNTGSQAALGYNSFGTSGTSLFLLPSQSTVSPYSQAAQTHSYLLPSQSFSQPTLQTHYLAQPTQLMTAQPQQILFPQQSYPSQTQNAYHSSLYPPTAYAAYSTSGYPNSTYQSSTHAYITPFQATVPDVNQQTIAGQTIALQPTISLQAVSQPSLGINPSSVSSVGSNGCLASVLQAMPQQAITSLPSSIVNPSLHGAGAGSAVVQGTASGSTIVPGANALIIQGNNTTTSLSRAVIHGSVNASAMLPGSNAPSSSVSMPVVQQFSTGTAVVITTTQPMNTAVNSSTSGHISIAPRIGPVQTEIKTSSPARRRGTKKSAAIAPALKKINSRKLPVGEDRVLSTANSISNIISLSDSVSMTLVSSTSNSTCVPLTSLCNVVPNSFATSIVVPELQILSKSSSPGFQSDLSSRVEATYAGDKIEAAEPFDLLLQLDALESMQKSLTKETIRSYDAILHETPNFNINEPAPEVNPITSTCSQNTLETQLAPATASPVSSSHLDDSGSAELQVQVIKTEPESPAEAESELKIVENDPVENPIAEDSSDLFLLEEVNAVPGSTSISEELCVSKTKSEMSKKGAAACLKTPEKKMSNPRSCELSSSELDCKQSTSDEANLPIAHAASESTSDIAYMRLEKEVLATVAFDALESLSHRKDLNVEKLPASVGAEVEDRSCGVLNISESVLSVDESTAYASEKSKSESNSQTLNCQMLSPGKSSEHVDDLVSLKSIDENISVDSKFKDLNQSPSFENSEKSNKHDESKVPLIEEIISLASDKKKVDSNTDNSVADVNPVRDLYLDASKSNCTLTSKLSDSDSIVANLDDSKMSLITPAVTDENDASFIHTDPEVSEMTVQDV